MSLSDPLDHLGSIWYHSEPLEVPYSPNQFLGWDFFCRFLQQTGSSEPLAVIFAVDTTPYGLLFSVGYTYYQNSSMISVVMRILIRETDDFTYMEDEKNASRSGKKFTKKRG